MFPTEDAQVSCGAVSVVPDRGVEWRRRKGQRYVSFIIDRIDTFSFRVSAMPVRTSVNMRGSGVGRNLHDEVGVLILTRSDDEGSFFINLPGPSFRSIEPYLIHN